MVRTPNKLYTIQESTIWQMYQICQAIPEQGISATALCETFPEYAVDDFIDALTGLYAIREIDMNNQIIKRHVAGDTL